jgi:hypothetical protein
MQHRCGVNLPHRNPGQPQIAAVKRGRFGMQTTPGKVVKVNLE